MRSFDFRFGVGDFDWKEFTSRMKQKTYEEIKEYGVSFTSVLFVFNHRFRMLLKATTAI